MKLSSMLLMTAIAASGTRAALAIPPEGAVLVTGDPVVMRLNKDEFRIVFGIDGRSCAPHGCSGSVSYWVDWTASDGTARSERKEVSYIVSPDAARTIAVDRQYLDTATPSRAANNRFAARVRRAVPLVVLQFDPARPQVPAIRAPVILFEPP
jgi:hypothetical protein